MRNVWLVVVCLMAGACGDDSAAGNGDNGTLPATPGGGMVAPGTPGSDATDGMPGGDPTPATPGGDPVPATPGGDPVPATPGGEAGGGAPPAATGVAGCDAADTTGADLHGGAAAVLAVMTPCGFSSCHTGNGKAGLVLNEVADLNAALVGITSCEAPALPLVDNQGGDAGLNNSWLWLKMTAPAMTGGAMTPDPSWGTPGNCGQAEVGSYGSRMPLAGTPDPVSEERLAPIRNWICAGAPAPGT